MNILRTAAFSFLVLAPALHAAEKNDAEVLVDLAFGNTAMSGAKAAFTPFLEQARKNGIPEQGLKEISDAADAFFNKTFNDPELRKEVVKLYQDSFTADELHEIVAFYNTPAGKKTLSTLPLVAQKGALLGQKYAAKNQSSFQEELRVILERYQKPAAAPEAPKPDKK